MKMHSLLLTTVALLMLAVNAASAPKSFHGLSCGMDIEHALLGREMPNERVASIEARHKDLALRDLGGYEVSDKLFLIFWRICENEYVLLEQGTRVRAVLKIPEAFKGSGDAIICYPVGKKPAETIIAISSSIQTEKTIRPAAAWKVDEKRISFVPISTVQLDCDRSP